jgi:hypothetical protein
VEGVELVNGAHDIVFDAPESSCLHRSPTVLLQIRAGRPLPVPSPAFAGVVVGAGFFVELVLGLGFGLMLFFFVLAPCLFGVSCWRFRAAPGGSRC